jgi:hypothetical protein
LEGKAAGLCAKALIDRSAHSSVVEMVQKIFFFIVLQ